MFLMADLDHKWQLDLTSCRVLSTAFRLIGTIPRACWKNRYLESKTEATACPIDKSIFTADKIFQIAPFILENMLVSLIRLSTILMLQ